MILAKIESYNCYSCELSGQPAQEYITCDLPKQNWGLKLKYKQNKLKCLHLLGNYFQYLGTKTAVFSKTCRNISVLFPTKCHFFHYLVLFGSHNINNSGSHAYVYQCRLCGASTILYCMYYSCILTFACSDEVVQGQFFSPLSCHVHHCLEISVFSLNG